MSKSDILSSKNIKQWIVGSCATLLLLSAIIAGNLVGCGNSKGVNTIADKKVDLTPTNELVLDIPRYRWFPQYYKDAIEEFEEQYPDVKVTVNRLGDKEDHTMEQYQTALTNELMAGAGPDVILTDYFTSDLYKTIQDGKASNSKIHLAGMLQKEGNMLEIDNIVLPKSSKNSKLAYCFIDTVLRPQNAAYLANDTGSTVPNRKGVPLVDPSVTKINWIYPPANAKVYSFTAYTPATRNMVNAKWIELKMNCGK